MKLHVQVVYVVVVGLVLGFGIWAGAYIRGEEFKLDLTMRLCNPTIGEMPDSVPESLFMDITDEWNRTLSGEVLLVVEGALDSALTAFAFSDRIHPRYEGADPAERQGENHTVRLVLVLGRSLELMDLTGAHCSNHVFVAYTRDQQSLTLRLVHELGHFFGLSHEWGDATYMGYAWCWGTHAERFNQEQLEILDVWNRPGSPDYIPHWERANPGGCPWLLALYIIPFAVLAGVVIYVTIIRRREREGR